MFDGAVDTNTPAVVLKLDRNVFHHGGLGVIRSLGRAGIDVYGVHEDPLAPAAHSRYLRGRWYWTPDLAESDRVVDGLRRLGERLGRPAVLIPTDDAGAILLSERASELRTWFRFAEAPSGLPRRLADKFGLHSLCQQWNVPHVTAALASTWDEATDFTDTVGLPLVAKLVTPWHGRSRNSPRSTTIVRSRSQLAHLYRDAPDGALLLQEYIPPTQDQDWFFHGYCDARSRCDPGFTGIKVRSYPPHSGLTSLGHATPNPRLHRQVIDLLSRIRYCGIMDLDIRLDPRDGQYKLLDFNPRIGAQFRLFESADGVDVARAAYLDLTGHPIPTGNGMVERRFLVENYDALAALGYLRRGELGVRSWLSTLRRIDETAWFAADDLAPFGLMCLRMAWRAVERRFGRTAHTTATSPRFRPTRRRTNHHRSARGVRQQAARDASGPAHTSTTLKEETPS